MNKYENSITEDAIRLRLFQSTIIGVVANRYVDQPHASHPPLWILPNTLFPTSNYLSTTTQTLKSWLLFVKLLPPAFLTMSKSGTEGGSIAGPLNSKTMYIWIDFLEHYWLP